VASGAFTVWRNSEIAVLVDIAYPLNTATRIALGEVPYRDFPLAQAPLHFVVQAVLIRTLGPNFLVQIAYASVLAGIAAVLAYALARRLIDHVVPMPKAVAFVLVLPLIPLGIHSIYPHPFYDADACVAVLAATYLVFVARERRSPGMWIIAGAALTLPLWIKQNIGGAFLVATIAALALEALRQRSVSSSFRWCIAGTAAALAIELAILHGSAGVDAYLRWGWTYALSGRGVALGRIEAFWDPRTLWPAAVLLMAVFLARRARTPGRPVIFMTALLALGVIALVAPSLVPSVPEFFPPVMGAAAVLGAVRVRGAGATFEAMLPWVLVITAAGTFMSQGLGGSSFAIFPLLVVAGASLVRETAWHLDRSSRVAPALAVVLSILLVSGGTAYTLSNGRLAFVHLDPAAPVQRSTFPSLAGLATRGPYVRDLDEILYWIEAHVPAEDPLAFLPGEDPVFFALGRRPALPSVYFFDVASPLSVADLVVAADERGLRWVFVKDRLQLVDAPPQERELETALTQRATFVGTIGAYRVYRR